MENPQVLNGGQEAQRDAADGPAVSHAQTVSQEITEKLTRRITTEAYPAGSKLPTERELALEFGVTRHVVREALKRLEAVGLVRIRQGSGIYVQDIQLSGDIALFHVVLRREDGSIDLSFLHDVLEYRDQIIQLVVRFAAARRTEEELEAIRRLVVERREAMGDPARLEEVNERVYLAIARAAHNKIFVFMFNSMSRILLELRRQFEVPIIGIQQGQEFLERLVQAIEQKDDEMAGLLAIRHLGAVRRALFGSEKGRGPL